MTIDDLVIKPEFENLIPKLTEEENKQLEENILTDGRVKEPITVWGNIIVDGHHRYYILKKHPDIPYTIEQMEFANEYAAMAWACANQLGRRNLNEWQHDYLVGKRQESERLAHGLNPHAKSGRFESYRKSENPINGEKHAETALQIASEEGITRDKVYEDQKLSKGLDAAEEVVEGLRDRILNREESVSKISKAAIRRLSKATPDVQRKASIAISEGRIEDAKNILNPEPPAAEPEPYNIEDMVEEIKAAASELHFALNQTLIVLHQDVFVNEENRSIAKECLLEIETDVQEFISKISE